ncbi:unnamed protein product [Arabis nemorensis]|uniref:Uncharacterized protein n=1 Tax=Arabis nemorensis TaxID=586526 RepID=A0A565CRV2_9BRAS|nr:unnamed protein product [Arabis nemorensis]
MDSGGDEFPLQPLFLCPTARINFLKSKLKKDDDYYTNYHPFHSSPHFPNTRSGDQEGESLLDCNDVGICKLPLIPLFWCSNKNSDDNEEFLSVVHALGQCSAQSIMHV